MVNRIHGQCHECVKFIEDNCRGKAPKKKQATFFGSIPAGKVVTGLAFCKFYEFDERLYVYPDKMPSFKTVKKEAVVKHKRKKKQAAAQDHSDLVDEAASLNLDDLKHLLEDD